jgi:predicted  nucleic acid-binding Zn-ribbon protein
MGWKYKTVEVSNLPHLPGETEAVINKMGLEGWEPAEAVGNLLIFKMRDGEDEEKGKGTGLQGSQSPGWKGGREIACTECGYVMERPQGEPLVSIECPECGNEGFEFVKTVLPKEEREALVKHLEDIDGQIAVLGKTVEEIRVVLKKCGGGGGGGAKKKKKAEVGKENPLASVHACMTCDDFSVEKINRKEGSVGGTCAWKGWATNGSSDCNGWVLKGTPDEEKTRIRAALKEEASGEGKPA